MTEVASSRTGTVSVAVTALIEDLADVWGRPGWFITPEVALLRTGTVSIAVIALIESLGVDAESVSSNSPSKSPSKSSSDSSSDSSDSSVSMFLSSSIVSQRQSI
jgi:hypothetical protein